MAMEHLAEEQKQLANEALEAAKKLLENLRVIGSQLGRSEAGRNVNAGITAIEAGLKTAKHGLVTDQVYDPTIKLQKVA